MEGWTKITPEQIEAIGFVDLTEEDRTNLAYYEYRGKKPEHVEWMFMNFLAVYWELSFSSDIDEDEYHDIKTAEEFNHWMKYIGLEIRL